MTPGALAADIAVSERPFDDLLSEAVGFHGHLCPGVILGTRMATIGCRQIELDRPLSAGKNLVVFVEIDRCATDAITAVTGATLGKRTLKLLDYGKMAATFVNVRQGMAVRISVPEAARGVARGWAPDEPDARAAQTAAYRIIPEAELFKVERVVIDPVWLDRSRVRVLCDACGEGINYRREISRGDRTLCRPCAGDSYYSRCA